MSKKRPKRPKGLSETDKRVICLLAQYTMNATAVADVMRYHRNTVMYHVDLIRRETGKDPMEFYDLIELLTDLGEMPGQQRVTLGRWLKRDFFGQKAWECSECKTLGSPYWKRCPVCEAKMDLEGGDGK